MPKPPLITVIVPVYNVAPYLDDCLRSIVAQSYEHLEVIVVDDGSTDGSAALCDQWAMHDRRITVIHQPNAGLSCARNAALDAMHGALVTMIDGDDMLAPGSIAALYEAMQRTGADVVMGNMTKFADAGPVPAGSANARAHASAYSRDQAIQGIYYQRHGLNHSSCARLFVSSLFNGLRYPPGMLYEDLAIALDLQLRVSKMVLLHTPVYLYRQRHGSILASFNPRRAHVLDILEQQEQQAARDCPHHLAAVRSRKMSAALNMLRLVPANSEQYEPLLQRSWHIVRQLRRGTLLDPHTRLQNKATALLSYLGLGLLRRAIARGNRQ